MRYHFRQRRAIDDDGPWRERPRELGGRRRRRLANDDGRYVYVAAGKAGTLDRSTDPTPYLCATEGTVGPTSDRARPKDSSG